MPLKWLLIISVVATLLFLLHRKGVKPIYYRHLSSADFLRFTTGLLSQGGHGALLFIHHEGSDRFVQFAKYLEPTRMIHFGFPDSPWSRKFYEAVKSALSAAGYRCQERVTSDDKQIPRFLYIDGLWTAEQAAAIAETAFLNMGLNADARYTIHQEGPISLAEWKRHVRLTKN